MCLYAGTSIVVIKKTQKMFKIPASSLDMLETASPMVCKPPFEGMDSNKFRVISRPDECIVVLFYQRAFSNFSKCNVPVLINNKQVFFPCGEAMFKCACAAYFKNWAIFEKVFKSNNPLEAKLATRDIPDFNREEWDAVSYHVMLEVQKWKSLELEIFDSLQIIHELARKSRVDIENVIFMESTSKDTLWGTGIDTDELATIIEESNTEDILSGAIYEPSENLLGLAITTVFQEIAGKTHEAYLAEVNMTSTLFAVDPDLQ